MTLNPKNVDERRYKQYRIRTMMMAIVVIAVWLAVLGGASGVLWPVIWFVVVAVGASLGLMLGLIGLVYLGFGLFAIGDRVLGWLKRAAHWPEG